MNNKNFLLYLLAVAILLILVAARQSNQRDWLLEYESVEYPYPAPVEPTSPPPYPAPVEPAPTKPPKVKKPAATPTIQPTDDAPFLALPGTYIREDGKFGLYRGHFIYAKEMKVVDGVQWYWFNPGMGEEGWFRRVIE